MDETTELRKRRLELATGRSDPAGETLDPEMADLREGWSSLVRLLEAAEADSDEPVLRVSLLDRRRSHQRHWIGLAALAASLLLAVSAVWTWSQSGSQNSKTSAPIVVRGPTPAASVAAPAVAAVAPAQEDRWDDAWEEHLARLDQSFVRMRSGWGLSDPSLEIANEQLQEIGREMNTEL